MTKVQESSRPRTKSQSPASQSSAKTGAKTGAPNPDTHDLSGVTEMCVCLNLRKASRVVTRRYDRAFAKVGLRATQTPVLLSLSINGPLTLSELADELAMDVSTMSRNFSLLEGRGLVSRSQRDGRTLDVSITDAGTTLLAEALEGWSEVQAKTLAEIGPENWAVIMGALAKLGEADEPQRAAQ